MTLTLRFPWAIALLLLLFLISGCSRANNDPEATQVENATATQPTVGVTLSPQPTPTNTPTPEPTPIAPRVVIADQTLDEDGVLVAAEVSLPVPGWLVIYRVVNGQADEPIGHQPLAGGVHEDVSITVDPDLATEDLLAGLHLDLGAEGVFEFPGEDEPFPGEPEAEFTVELIMPQPQIEVADQAIAEDGVLTLAMVELLEPTWIAIHTDDGGRFGPVIGARLMEAGTYEDVTLTINWRRATPTLNVVLHEDGGKTGVMEYPDDDMPLLRNGEPIVVSFEATYPPEILVYDQPIIDNQISIERVISDGPGWIAIYNEAEGQPGFIIGTEALEDGLNERITVELLPSAITPLLFARLHEDTEAGDAFNFPGQDPPVLFNNRMPTAAAFRTDIGAHAFVNDQRLGEDNSLSVATIISPVDLWAAIYSDADGQPGEILGQTWVPAGISRDVVVDVGETVEPGVLYLILYQDLGVGEEFEVPGVDPALTNDDNRPIRIPFTLNP